MGDDVTNSVREEFDALTDKAVVDMLRIWSERSQPLVRSMFNAADTETEANLAASLLSKTNTMLASIACGTLMTVTQGDQRTLGLVKMFAEQFDSTLHTGVKACFDGEVLPATFDAASGQPVPFDFRDHLKRDSGRASEVGG